MENSAKLNWYPIIVEYSNLCGKYYIDSSTDPASVQKFKHSVKILEAYIIRWLPETWASDRKKLIEELKKTHQKQIKDGPLKFERELYYAIFLNLMKAINDAKLIL